MGEREASLGSLREAEGLFRQAKRRAQEIVTWWEQAEEAIRTAEELLTGQSGATIDNLRQIVRDAKKQLDREAPKKAFELACVIPIQLQADGDAKERLSKSSVMLRRRSRLQMDSIHPNLSTVSNKPRLLLKQVIPVNPSVWPKVSFVSFRSNVRPWKPFDGLFDNVRKSQNGSWFHR